MNQLLMIKKVIKKIGIYQQQRNYWKNLHNQKYRNTLFLIENKKDLLLPENVTFELTTRCNLNCSMCHNAKNKQLKPDLSTSQTKDLLIKLKKELNIKSVSLI